MITKLYLSIVALLFTASCVPVGAPVTKELMFPKAEYYDALVITNQNVIALVDGGNLGDLQSYVKENNQEFIQFAFPDDPQCDPVGYEAYETLPDGRLQVWKSCLTGTGSLTYLLAYDWHTRALEQVAGPLPLGSSGASWNPDETKAIAYLDGGFATKTLYWISKDGFAPLDLVIGDPHRSWNLKDDFPDFKTDETGKTGTTGRAAWSPDGKSIAFFASPEAIGKTGFARFGVEFGLYLLDPETLQYRVVSDGIYSPFLLQWSPDSTQIAFIGKYGFRKENGIWLYSVNTKSITNIAKGDFKSLVWLPDGRNLAAIRCKDIDTCAEVLNYDLTNVLQP